LYIVNDKHFGFEIVTDKLDYRDDESSTVIKSKFSDDIVNKTKQLVKKLNLNFSASDFMEDESGIWYLETNTNPMFVAFDQEVNNQISFEIVNGLK
jgi:D-alanine-D-alanine ligase-like ATP-grasp enzyme